MRKRQSGFTIIELVVIVAITAVIVGASLGGLFRYRNSHDIKITLGEFAALIRETQRKSVTQQDGKRWGVRFENTESGRDRMLIFKGLNYASSSVTQTIALRRGISFIEPQASSTHDIVFLPIEGTLSLNKVITLTTGVSEAPLGDVIISLLGKVTTRLENGLVGYWHFDEGTSTLVYDVSGKNRTGTFAVNAPAWNSGTGCKAGNCLTFTADRITTSVESPIFGTAPFTLSAWMNIDSTAYYGLAVYMGNDASSQSAWIGWVQSAQVGTSNSIGGGFYASNYGSGITDTAGWHHVALTFSGGAPGTAKIYVDGIERVSNSYTPNIGSGSVAFGHDTYPYSGGLDEVKIYNRELSAEEILAQYNDLR